MKDRKQFDEHPRKIRVEGFNPETGLRAEEGWVNMSVKFLVTDQTVGSEKTVFGLTVFPPGGSKHDVHRHPNAEETMYLLEGAGVARVGDDEVTVRAGEIVFVAANEYHSFENTSPTERAVMVWCYGGASSLKAAGYATEHDDRGGAGPK